MSSRNEGRSAIVIGAGPAGMGAAIGLARKGVRVAVIERQEDPGTVRRGETIRRDEQMDQILGKGFFERIALRKVCRRRYYSHTGLRHVDRTIKNPNIIFSWPDLLECMRETARRDGVIMHTGMRATGMIFRDGRVEGIRVVRGQSEQVMPADTVFLCGGCDGPASIGIAQDRNGIDMSANKRLVTCYSGPDDRLEYHFHLDPEGLVVGTMFPRGNGEAEFILLNTSGTDTRLPSFDVFCSEHPLFSGLMEGTRITYELATRVPMGGMLHPFSPVPGLVMAGDALGHVQARGGSGIRTSFLIGHAAGSLAADVMHTGTWSEMNRRAFERAIRRHHHVRSLRLHNLFYAGLRTKLFRHIHSPEHMDNVWRFLSLALR